MQNSLSLERALTLEGFLKKKSPSALAGFQKRYFIISQQGSILAYYKRKPKSGESPKGILYTSEIASIESVNETDFKFLYKGRNFLLKAGNADYKNMWVLALEMLCKRQPKNLQVEEDGPKKSWKPKHVDESVLNDLRATERTRQSFAISPHDFNQQVMSIKGIWDYIGQIPEQYLTPRLICGFLNKRNKSSVKFLRKKWFILMSAAPLTLGFDDYEVTETSLPSWMHLNYIYYFRFNGLDDDSEAQGHIPTRLVNNIKIKDMSRSRDSGHSFLLDIGTRIFHLNAETQEDMERWISAIEISRGNALQTGNSRTDALIAKEVIVAFEKAGEPGVYDLVNEKFAKALPILEELKDITEATSFGRIYTQECISIINGCLVYDDEHMDVAEAYAKIFHKRMSEFINESWKRLNSSIQLPSILHLIKWAKFYRTELESVGITDQKISNGIRTLSLFLNRRCFNELVTRLAAAMNTLHSEVPIDSETQLYSVCYGEICSYLEPLIFEIQDITDEEFCVTIFSLTRDVFSLYEKCLDGLVKNQAVVSFEGLIGLCNDSLLILDRATTWQNLLKNYIDEGTLNLQLRLKDSNFSITRSGLLVKDYLVHSLLLKIDDKFKSYFNEVQLEGLLSEIYSAISHCLPYTHKEISKHVWRGVLFGVVDRYTHSVLRNKASLKNQTILLLAETIKSDCRMIESFFEDKMDNQLIENEISGLSKIVDYLEALPYEIKDATEKLSNEYPKLFTFDIAKFLIERRTDLEKKEIIQCIEIVKKFMETHRPEENRDRSRGSNLFDLIPDEEQQNKPRADTKTLEKHNSQRHVNAAVSIQGKLQKKSKHTLLKWHERFYSVKGGRLYWYKHAKSYEAINSLSLDSIISVGAVKSKKPKFKVVTSDKEYTLVASNIPEMEKWIEAIKDEEREAEPKNLHINLETTKESLFEDTESKHKNDIRKLANIVVGLFPSVKSKKRTTYIEVIPDEDDDDTSGCCLCLFKKKKKPLGEPLLIN